MRSKKERSTYTSKEIGVAINNAFGAASNSIHTIGQTEDRRRKLRNYTMELANVIYEDVNEGFLKVEELIQSLVGAALFLQCVHVLKSTKVPYFEDMTKRMLEDESGE